MLVVEQIASRHLAGNRMGDPSRRDLAVYLPPAYETSARRYPTCVGRLPHPRRETNVLISRTR